MSILLAIVPSIIEIPFVAHKLRRYEDELNLLEEDENRKAIASDIRYPDEEDLYDYQRWLNDIESEVVIRHNLLEINEPIFEIEKKQIKEDIKKDEIHSQILDEIYRWIKCIKIRRIDDVDSKLKISVDHLDIDMIPLKHTRNTYIIRMRDINKKYPITFECIEAESELELLLEAVYEARKRIPHKAFKNKSEIDKRDDLRAKIKFNKLKIKALKIKSWLFRIYWCLFPSQNLDSYEIINREELPAQVVPKIHNDDQRLIKPVGSEEKLYNRNLNAPALYAQPSERIFEEEYSELEQDLYDLRQEYSQPNLAQQLLDLQEEVYEEHSIQFNKSMKPRR